MAIKKKEKAAGASVDYVKQVIHNEESFKMLVKNLRPDIFVLMDLLDKTGISLYVVFHIIKHLNNIAIGTKYGKVVITVERGIATYVSGEETTRLDEMLKKT
jgi:hypothetical protein